MTEQDSFEHFMDRLRCRDDEAAVAIFERFAQRLIGLARSRLDDRVRKKVDPEDVMQSVYRSFFARQRDGRIELANWEGLWGVLTLITIRKCANQNYHFRAARRDVAREVSMDGSEIGAGPGGLARDPSPSEVAVLTETIERLFQGLEERDREIASLHLQGYDIPEISAQVDWAERTVHRSLERIRKRLGRLIDS